MGGTKKKSLGASVKSQDSGPQAAEVKKEEKKGKKEKGSKGLQQKAKISVILNEGEGMKALRGLKAITPQALARNTGVKISVANALIRSLESKDTIKCVGGFSGHRVYSLVQEMKQKSSSEEGAKPKEQVSSEETAAQ
ncbi:MAG: MarR family transcriptional regulator [Nitrososphaerales archaeon]